MQAAIEKADVLIEALGWIREFRGKTTVIKLGGSLLDNPDAMLHILIDIVFMETVGMNPIIVHGGGAAISRAMNESGIEPRFVQGRRYTDDATLEIVKRVLAQDVNHFIVDEIVRLGGEAEPLNFTTTNVLHGEQLTIADDQGRAVDLGQVGRVTRVDTKAIRRATTGGQVAVIPSICQSARGGYLNVNADTAATAVAKQLAAEKLVYLSDVNGVRFDQDDPESRIQSMMASEARQLIADGRISGGMIPKVEACLETLQNGVHKVHIIDGTLRHSLLLEVYTTTGVGTEIVQDRIGK